MPELPEVETIKNQLASALPFTIKKIVCSEVSESILKEKDKTFDPEGMTIQSFSRKGKMLIMDLGDEHFIFSHLGMSGSWRINPDPLPPHSHIRLIGEGKKGVRELTYVDPRRFGNMHFLAGDDAVVYCNRLGVDIAGSEFTAEYIYSTLKKYPERKLKVFLLDQAYFAGVGNYIACEICALAGIRPTRKAGKVTKAEAKKIKKATGDVLGGQIKAGGLTFSGGYSDAFGDKGEGVSNLVVFNQKECQLCGGEVKKIVLAQRGTYYCPRCQK
jgi:formamidopyrimidine-DNA glycosylase